jgi:ABC-type transporter Mla MlaB component
MAPGRGPGQGAQDADLDLDVSWLVPADVGAVDVLARLQLTAARCGRSLQLHGAHGGLPELLDFFGLLGVLHLCECCHAGREQPDGPANC